MKKHLYQEMNEEKCANYKKMPNKFKS